MSSCSTLARRSQFSYPMCFTKYVNHPAAGKSGNSSPFFPSHECTCTKCLIPENLGHQHLIHYFAQLSPPILPATLSRDSRSSAPVPSLATGSLPVFTRCLRFLQSNPGATLRQSTPRQTVAVNSANISGLVFSSCILAMCPNCSPFPSPLFCNPFIFCIPVSRQVEVSPRFSV